MKRKNTCSKINSINMRKAFALCLLNSAIRSHSIAHLGFVSDARLFVASASGFSAWHAFEKLEMPNDKQIHRLAFGRQPFLSKRMF